MKEIILVCQIFISAILIILILLQQRGGTFSFSQSYFKRRGAEKIIFFLTILFSFLFIIFALANLLI